MTSETAAEDDVVVEVDTPASRSWIERHARSMGLLVFVVGSFLWFAKVWVNPLYRHAGVPGDPEAYIFTLAWAPYAIAHHMNPFYSLYLLAPKGANLMWSIPPGFGVLLTPVTVVLGPVLTYNLLATLSLAFSAWTAQLALRRFVPGELGPFAGGLFYGFSPYMAAHSLGHVMLTVAVLPPLLILVLHEALIRQRWRPALTGLALGALLAFQISTFLEMLAGAAVAAAILVVLLAVSFRKQIRERLPYIAITAASTIVSFLVLAGYQLRTLIFGARSLVGTDALLHPKNVFVTDLFGFVVPSGFNAVAPPYFQHVAAHFGAVSAELNGYIGLPMLIVVIVIAVRNWQSMTVRIASVMTAIMAVLSMGPRLQLDATSTIPLPWALIERLPLMQNLLPVRLSVFTDLGVALLVAYGIGHRRPSPSRQRIVVRFVAAAAVVLTLLPSTWLLSQLWTPVAVPAYFTSSQLKNVPKGSIALVAPWTTDPSNDDPEVWQAYAHFRFRLPSGYAYLPAGQKGVSSGRLTDALEIGMRQIALGGAPPDIGVPAVRADLQNRLVQHQISTVIVGPMLYEPAMVQFMTDLLGRAPQVTGGVFVWYHVGHA